MTEGTICQSCSMPIESGLYCPHCVDEHGELQPFEVRFERMVQWMLRSDPSLRRTEAELRTRAHMRTMPAWKDHPRLAE
ncbi:MAG: hypothetical protein MUF27_09750 [Acidobacteria bacterium]|nr:hypothetical protein [Acidobacteriota bacterium]